MAVDMYTNHKIYQVFCDEWFEKDCPDWCRFILEKNLGISYIDDAYDGEYVVTDIKKWLMSRLKYGI